MTPETHLLIVDDDDRIRDLLKQYLVREGHSVTTAQHAAAARKLFQTFSFDLAIFDIMMPGEDGLSLLKALRDEGNDTPVLLLTARGQASDRIEGLRLGADDYLPKPFEPEELALRTAAIIRRTHVPPPPDEIEMSGLVFEPTKGLLTGPDGHIRLTDSELQLLTFLSQHPGEPISREALADKTSNGTERSIDVQVTRLRKKIEPDPRNPIHIQTVRGIGYRLMPD
jgi:two-component system phosphate regulon response regulator OmpR